MSAARFNEDFLFAQQAFAEGDLETIVERLEGQRQERAQRRAARVRAYRAPEDQEEQALQNLLDRWYDADLGPE